jgi:hypothetical protein
MVSGRIRESSKLRARITAIFFDQFGQFSERHFASAVLVPMMVSKVEWVHANLRVEVVPAAIPIRKMTIGIAQTLLPADIQMEDLLSQKDYR